MNPKPLIQPLPLLSCLALWLLCATAHALPSDKTQEMKFSTKSSAYDSKQGRLVLTGQVKIIQGTLEMTADKVTLIYDDKQKLQSLVAEGLPARYQQQPEANQAVIHAEANSITYNLSKEHLTLDKNALVEQKGATTRGGRIDYDITAGTVSASGAGNVNGVVEFVIPPQAQTDKQTNKKE